MLKWEKLGRTVRSDGGTDTLYAAGKYRIESRKRMIPHASRGGSWAHTTFFLFADGKEREFQRLKDAKEAAEKMEAAE